MAVARKPTDAAWLLLTFTLPVRSASQRVEVWRKLRRYGAVPLGNSGYLLPNGASNQERFEWLAAAIRKHGGEAAVLAVASIDSLSTPRIVARFVEARGREYQALIRDVEKFSAKPPRQRSPARMRRLRARFLEIAEIDFFKSPLQKRAADRLARADAGAGPPEVTATINPRDYRGRVWVTRPRPGIDRSASAWLIRRFIDEKARFTFAVDARVPEHAVPYDMFHAGFGHRGEDCSFETLAKAFRIRSASVRIVGEIIHDADLLDEKFGRKEGFGIDAVLTGFAKQGVPDAELLERGVQMIEALYQWVSRK